MGDGGRSHTHHNFLLLHGAVYTPMDTPRKPKARELYSSVDPKCRELADYFLPGIADETTRGAMAQHIQDVVDDWLLDFR
jgi:hypothetical protein